MTARRLPVVRRLVGMLATGAMLAAGLVAVAPPASAGLSMAIPMNQDEEPTYDFVDTDALLAYVLSDIKGGTLCVVPAGFEDPGALTCEGNGRAKGWSPNVVVGIGSQIVLIEGPNLTPGRWRILSAVNLPDGTTEGTALSEVFTVAPCTSGCDTSLTRAKVQQWKDAAAAMQVGATTVCAGFAAKQVRDAAVAARGRVAAAGRRADDYEAGWGGFTAVAGSVGAGLGMAFSFGGTAGVTAGSDKALAILADLSCSVAAMHQDIVNDPPDPAFATVEAPSYRAVPSLGSPGGDAVAAALDRQAGAGAASLTAFERYLGATEAGDATGVLRQLDATAEHSWTTAEAIRGTAAALRAYAIEVAALPGGEAPVVTEASLDQVLQLRRRVTDSGFTADERAQLTGAGLTPAQIVDVRSWFAPGLAAGLTPGVSLPNLLRAQAVVADEQAAAFDEFGQSAAVVAGRLRAAGQAPDGPPVAVVSAWTTSGPAPLSVVFDGRGSTDAEGPLSTFAWDFGDGSTATGSTTTHVYAAPGIWTVTLTITDSAGQTSSASTSVTSTNPRGPGSAPVASFTTTPTSGPAPLVVEVRDTSTDPDGDLMTRSWSFWDGTQETAAVVRRTLEQPGVVQVLLQVCDDRGYCSVTRRTIVAESVVPGNAPPMAVDDTVTATSGRESPAAFVLSNDSDLDGDPLTVVSWTAPNHGVVVCDGASCRYTSGRGYLGSDSFSYDVVDGRGGRATARVQITVQPSAPPVATDSVVQVRERKAVGLALPATDPEGEVLAYRVLTGPVHGSLGDCAIGFCSYRADDGFTGTDAFTWEVSDGTSTAVAELVLQVTANQPPVAVGATDRVPTGLARPISFSSVDPDSDPVTVEILDGPTRGALTDCAASGCVYTSDRGYLGADRFTWRVADDLGATSDPVETLLDVVGVCWPGACIDDGTIALGVRPEGNLNLDRADTGRRLGLTHLPTGHEATAPGCPCEGWGVADADTGLTGYANLAFGGAGLEVESFTSTPSSAVSVVRAGGRLRVTHDYHPSTEADGLYEVLVTVENIGAEAVADLRYRRVMDWDVEPTPFAEHVTIETGDSTALLFSSDNGFASSDPLSGPSQILFAGEAVDSGPADHGALFDFGFGRLAAGASLSFTTFYGAAPTEAAAVAAVTAARAEVYSFGQSSLEDGPTVGGPATFVFAFRGVGGRAVFAPDAKDDVLDVRNGLPASVEVLANDTDPDGDLLTVTTLTPEAALGTVRCTAGGRCTYTPAPGATGTDSFTYGVSDGRGGSDTATVRVTLAAPPPPPDLPPAVDAGAPITSVEGSPATVSGTATDPEGRPLVLAWTATPGPGVDAGATCVLATPAAASTSVTCTDDGTWTLTLSADDGTTRTSDSAALTVANAAPITTLTAGGAAAITVETGTAVQLGTTWTDASGNDTHACSLDLGDGTTVTPAAVRNGATGVSGTCTASRSWDTPGARTVTATVTDDDGGTMTASVTVTVTSPPDLPPVVDAGTAVVSTEGSAATVTGTASDPEGRPLTLTWTATAGPGVDAGAACVLATPAAVSTSVTCTDDGTWFLTLTADDGTTRTSGTATFSVTNAPPVVGITAPAIGAVVMSGAPVPVNATVTDDGRNDTHTCTVSLGGTTVAGTIAATGSGLRCTASVTPPTTGVHSLLVTAVDDDGGRGSAEQMVVVADGTSLVTGGGWITDASAGRVSFGFVAGPRATGYGGQLEVRAAKARFHGDSVTTLVVRGSTATWTGSGRWGGVPGHTFTATTTDGGSGRKSVPDSMTVVVRDPAGRAVLNVRGSLKGGTTTVHAPR